MITLRGDGRYDRYETSPKGESFIEKVESHRRSIKAREETRQEIKRIEKELEKMLTAN